MKNNFMAYIQRDSETGFYIGIVPELYGAHTHAETLEELNVNLQEVIELCYEELKEKQKKELPEFVGIQQFHIKI